MALELDGIQDVFGIGIAKRILSNKTEALSIPNRYTSSINLVAAYMIPSNNSYKQFLCA